MGTRVVLLSILLIASAELGALFFFATPLIVLAALLSGGLLGRSYASLRSAALRSFFIGFLTWILIVFPLFLISSPLADSIQTPLTYYLYGILTVSFSGLVVGGLAALPAFTVAWLTHQRGHRHFREVSLMLTGVLIMASLSAVYLAAIQTQESQAAFVLRSRGGSSTSTSSGTPASSITASNTASQSSAILASIPSGITISSSLGATCQGLGLPRTHGTLSFRNSTNAIITAFSLTYGGITYDFPQSKLGGCRAFPGYPINVYITALPVPPSSDSEFTGFIVLQDGTKVSFSGNFS